MFKNEKWKKDFMKAAVENILLYLRIKSSNETRELFSISRMNSVHMSNEFREKSNYKFELKN